MDEERCRLLTVAEREVAKGNWGGGREGGRDRENDGVERMCEQVSEREGARAREQC